jgi:nucleoside 2-deoxyribosyltransferase
MTPRIYLCGAIAGCTDSEASGWRDWFKNEMDDITWLDPMDRDYRGKELENYREIVELDKRDVESSDIVLVMYTKPSVGTSMEIFYAHQLGIPVLTIDRSAGPISPWLIYHSTAVVDSKHAAINKIYDWI